jgi:hypothetical protein
MSSRIQVYSGGVFDPLVPDPADLDIADIAHALSLQCRFNGHTKKHYSVAQHSVHCTTYLFAGDLFPTTAKQVRTALLHDAAEAYLGDMPSPLKQDPVFGASYRTIEDHVMRAVVERFDIEWPVPPEVKEIDLRMLATERRDLLNSSPESDAIWEPWLVDVIPYEKEIVPVPAWDAEKAFLGVFKYFGGVR